MIVPLEVAPGVEYQNESFFFFFVPESSFSDNNVV